MRGSRPDRKGKTKLRTRETSRTTQAPGGACFCLWCGHHQPYPKGAPNIVIKCSECGFVMTRQLAVM